VTACSEERPINKRVARMDNRLPLLAFRHHLSGLRDLGRPDQRW